MELIFIEKQNEDIGKLQDNSVNTWLTRLILAANSYWTVS